MTLDAIDVDKMKMANMANVLIAWRKNLLLPEWTKGRQPFPAIPCLDSLCPQ
jgi:hypothetical protein